MPPPPLPMPLRPMQPAARALGPIPNGKSIHEAGLLRSDRAAAPIMVLPDDREPFVASPRSRALTTTGDGLVSRIVAWLGRLLPRKARRTQLARSRRTVPQTATGIRPSDQAEIDRLRRENKRLRGEIARLAEPRTQPVE